MPTRIREVAPGKDARTVLAAEGALPVPAGWELLPPGDPALTRRVKAAGPHWTMSEKRGRKVFSRGVWAPSDRIAAIRAELVGERADPAWSRRQLAAQQRRERAQAEYVVEFQAAVRAFLAFAPCHAELGERLAAAVAAHATPVGSGTVARTERIPVAERAAAAVIAWLRHQTTAYDSLRIARVRGRRREVRRELAEQSRRLLAAYRAGTPVESSTCPLARALARSPSGFPPADVGSRRSGEPDAERTSSQHDGGHREPVGP